MQPHLKYYVHFWVPQYKEDNNVCPEEGMVKVLEGKTYEKQPRSLGIFSLQKAEGCPYCPASSRWAAEGQVLISFLCWEAGQSLEEAPPRSTKLVIAQQASGWCLLVIWFRLRWCCKKWGIGLHDPSDLRYFMILQSKPVVSALQWPRFLSDPNSNRSRQVSVHYSLFILLKSFLKHFKTKHQIIKL